MSAWRPCRMPIGKRTVCLGGSPAVISLAPALGSFDLFRKLLALALAHTLSRNTHTQIQRRACIPPSSASPFRTSSQYMGVLVLMVHKSSSWRRAQKSKCPIAYITTVREKKLAKPDKLEMQAPVAPFDCSLASVSPVPSAACLSSASALSSAVTIAIR